MPVDTGEYAADGEVIREPYDVKEVFDSPVDLFNAIHAKAQLKPDGWDGAGLSRLLATYDWKYSAKSGESE